MDEELKKKLDEQGIKIDAIYKSVEKTRKYFFTMLWVTVITVLLPIVGLVFAIPFFVSNYVDQIGGLGL